MRVGGRSRFGSGRLASRFSCIGSIAIPPLQSTQGWGTHLVRNWNREVKSLGHPPDFTPYGSEMAHTSTCAPNYKFTGYERDSETQVDYARNRYYNPRLGRFLSADPLPSTNRYAYALNNPLSLVDPLGLSGCGTTTGSNDCVSDPSQGGPNGNDQPDLAAMTGTRGFGHAGCDQMCVAQIMLNGGWEANMVQWFDGSWSPWDYQYNGSVTVPCNGVVGTFCSQAVTKTFSSWSGYADWITSEAALFAPQNAELSQAKAVANLLGIPTSAVLAASPRLHGGNWNFLLPDIAEPSNCAASVGGDRCGTFPSLHFTAQDDSLTGWVHLDSANPSFWQTFVVGALWHGFEDYLLGHTIYASGIPR